MVSRLCELLFIEAVRNYSPTLEDQERGWLKGLGDQHVGRALALIHWNISNSWSVESLAKEVGLSRSGFVDRFTLLVGMPPIRYLTVSRLQTAKQNLSEKQTSPSALDVGPPCSSRNPRSAPTSSAKPGIASSHQAQRRIVFLIEKAPRPIPQWVRSSRSITSRQADVSSIAEASA